MTSLWEQGVSPRPLPPLPGDYTVDTAVIGGGLCGLLTAYELQKRGVEVMVLEANGIGAGTTGKSTAKVTSQHRLIYDRLIRQMGTEKAQQYATANQQAIEQYAALIEEEGIDCGWERRDAYVYTTGGTQRIEAEEKAARRLGLPAELAAVDSLPVRTAGAVKFSHQAQLHPLQFLCALADRLTVYQAAAQAIVDRQIYCDNRIVNASRIVVATHFPFVNFPGLYFARMHQQRSEVVALQNVPPVEGMYIDENEDGYSFRQAGDCLLLGGEGERTGSKQAAGAHARLHAAARRFYPQAEEVYHWHTQDCMTHDGVPFVGQYAKHTPGLYVATGFNKWGWTNSMAASRILADAITGRENPCAGVFDPRRAEIRAAARHFVIDMGVSVGQLTAGLFAPPQRRCPHLGCKLHEAEDGTFECRCHGSKFDGDGTCLQGPATRDKPVR